MRWSAGRPCRSTRAVKSESGDASGPATVRASFNDSVVAYSTLIRAGRSHRAQTIPDEAVTSPLATPQGIWGRLEVTRYGTPVRAAVRPEAAHPTICAAATEAAARVVQRITLRREYRCGMPPL